MGTRRSTCLGAIAIVLGLVLVGCDSDDSSGTAGTGADGSTATFVVWCSIDSPGATDKEIALTLAGSGQCAANLEATVTVENGGDGECSSDIVGTVQPGNYRMWFVSESGYGGARGRWEPMPANIAEGVGIILYPVGPSSWPIALPALTPGNYTFTIPAASCDQGQRRVEVSTDFDVSATAA